MELSPPLSPSTSDLESASSSRGSPCAPGTVAPTPPHVRRGRANAHLPFSPSLRRLSDEGVVKLGNCPEAATTTVVVAAAEKAEVVVVEPRTSFPTLPPPLPPPAYHAVVDQSQDKVSPPPVRVAPNTPARLSRSASRIAAASPNKGTPGLRRPGAQKVGTNDVAGSLGAPGTPEQHRQQLQQQKMSPSIARNKQKAQSGPLTPSTPPQFPQRVSTGGAGSAAAAGDRTRSAPPTSRKRSSAAVPPIDENSAVEAAPPRTPAPKNSSKAVASASGRSNGSSDPPMRAIPARLGFFGRRMLEVEVVEAAGLLGVESNGVSHPRCDVLLVTPTNAVLESEGVRKTAVVRETVDPVWRHAVSFGKKANLSKRNDSNILRVEVWHHRRFAADMPLGMVDIPLVQCNRKGEEWDRWYALQRAGEMNSGELGRIHIKCKIGPAKESVHASSRLFSFAEKSEDDRGDEEEQYEDSEPNHLRVTLHQAQELRAHNKGKNSSDPLVVFRVGKQHHRSTTVKGTVSPQWDETFDFQCSSGGESLDIIVENDNVFMNDFLGFVSILVENLVDKRKKKGWFDLTRMKDNSGPGEATRGSVEITTQWFYNPEYPDEDEGKDHDAGKREKSEMPPNTPTASDAGMGFEGDEKEEEEEHDDDDEREDAIDGAARIKGMVTDAKTAEEAATREEKKKKTDAELLKTLSDYKVVSGDYVAYVHIIEVRGLKGEDLQGTSDPVVVVETFGQKFTTEVMKDRLNAVFDETFVVNLRNMDMDDFNEGLFRISVMDADFTVGNLGSLKKDLIGAVSFDAAYIYNNKDHELRRRWVALVNDEDRGGDSSARGYLQVSIAIIGPNDRLKIHNEAEDRRKEKQAEIDAGGVDALVVMPPSIEIKRKWLVTTVTRAEYLPVMDHNVVGGVSGGDFFFESVVGGGQPFSTRKVTLSGDRHKLNPEWKTQLWQPVTTPCMSGNIKFCIRDWDVVGEKKIVGVYYDKVKDIERNTRETGGHTKARWRNLYGPPLTLAPVRGMKLRGKGVGSMGTAHDYVKEYENFPQRASTYRGRVLVKERVVENAPKGHETDKVAWRRTVKASSNPPTKQYVLKVLAGYGMEIPNLTSILGDKKMWLRVSIGRHEVATEPVENKDGLCLWFQTLEIKSNFALPEDPEQIPDVMIHLMAGGGSGADPFAFLRLSAKDLMDEEFGGKPQWWRLVEDKALSLIPDGDAPGAIFARFGFGTLASYEGNRQKWKDYPPELLKRDQYELRVHLYQARNLPPADPNGLMDPYLKIKFARQKMSTEAIPKLRRRETVDPIWYHTVQLQAYLPPIEFQEYFPQLAIHLFDYDAGWIDDVCGHLFLNLHDLKIIDAVVPGAAIPPPPTPKWVSFFMETPGDGRGELLVSLQLIYKGSPDNHLPPPPSIIPRTRTAYLEMTILGLRNMQPYKFLPMQLPYCVFEVDDMDGTKRSATTEVSNKPTGSDANFLQQIKMKLKLPLEVIYAPRVKIRVYDTRLGGFSIPLVGAGRIDLSKKLPWAVDYEPPLAKAFAKETLARAAKNEDDGEKDGQPQESKTPASAVENGDSGNRADEKEHEAAGVLGRYGFMEDEKAEVEGRPTILPCLSIDSKSDEAGGAMRVVQESIRSFNARSLSMDSRSVSMGSGVGVMPALNSALQREEMMSQTSSKRSSGRQKGAVDANGTMVARYAAAEHDQDVDEYLYGDDDEDTARRHAYMNGRATLDGSLEEDFVSTPFETYELYRGQLIGTKIGVADELKVVGKLKCIVRVTRGDPDNEPLFVDKSTCKSLTEANEKNAIILHQLLKPHAYIMRLYVLEAINLAPMDVGTRGRPGKSDPYLRVCLGKQEFNDRENYVEDSTDAKIYKCIELTCELPGASQLQIDVMDHNRIGTDELIGETTIDLEDRWFDARWQAWGLENRVVQERAVDVREKWRFETKPIEMRPLKVPTSNAPQGQVQCWMDLMTPESALSFAQDDISLPPALDYEVRVVIWKCKDVVSMDTILDQNDLFVRCWMEGCPYQETDTHWLAKKGKGSFNWRMKFKVSLGEDTHVMKFPLLTVQLWDRDLFKYNDNIAEGMLDLGPYLRRAYKTRDAVNVFPKVDSKLEKMRKVVKKKGPRGPVEGRAKDSDDPESSRLTEVDLEGGPSDPGNDLSMRKIRPHPPVSQPESNFKMAERCSLEGCLTLCCCCGLVGAGGANDEDGGEEATDEEERSDAKAFVSQIKQHIGLFMGDDPDESKWIKLERTDFDTGRKEQMGKVLMNIQIWPIEKAEQQPSGTGRMEPNVNPFLPPPTGRIRFSFNPFFLGTELVGPKICCRIACCCCCVISIVILVYFSGFFNFLINVARML